VSYDGEGEIRHQNGLEQSGQGVELVQSKRLPEILKDDVRALEGKKEK